MLRIIGVTLLAVVVVRNAGACSCILKPACGPLPRADFVFLAEAKSISRPTLPDNGERPTAWPVIVTFSEMEAFEGVTDPEVKIGTTEGCCMCGFEFKPGTRYLVFADQGKSGPVTGICNGTAPAEDAAALLRQLRAAKRREPIASIFGMAPSPNSTVVASGDAGETTTRSEPDRSFAFSQLPPGKYRVGVRGTGATRWAEGTFEVRPGATCRVDLH